jgi:multisubunit Na+/H+ antiporter MnhB subunit
VFTIEYLLVAVAILGVLIALLTNGGLFQTAITNITNNAQNSLSGGTNSVDAVVSGNLGAQRR